MNWVGVEVKDIINYIRLRDTEKQRGITRQAVNADLSKLVADGDGKKTRKGRYLSTEIFDDIAYDGWGVYESNLNMSRPFIIEDGNVLNLQSLGNIVLTLMNSSNETMEKFIFEIANRIGAFAVYVFLESLRSRRNVSTEDVRSLLTKEF